jgi:hypothetical protein
MKGALLDPRLAPRKGFSENCLAAFPRESASERTILRSSGTFDPLHEFDQWSNLAGTSALTDVTVVYWNLKGKSSR